MSIVVIMIRREIASSVGARQNASDGLHKRKFDVAAFFAHGGVSADARELMIKP